MSYRILHTADWHLGQRFYEYERTEEHLNFLKWLTREISEQEIDLLLIAGDIFDVANPSSLALKLLYDFLRDISLKNPHLHVIMVAGNHDSASRLEAPVSLLEMLNVRVVGQIPRNEDGSINYEDLLLPLIDRSGKRAGFCLAVPFLRPGDYPVLRDTENPYTEGIRLFYKELIEKAIVSKTDSEFLIATGHLHTAKASISSSERGLRGGLEEVDPETFSSEIIYTALGHIHKSQRVGEKEHIRYSGSPIPMSFSEINYQHKVFVVEIEDQQVVSISDLIVPRYIHLLRIGTPENPLTKADVMMKIAALPDSENEEYDNQPPYLEVNILLKESDPAIRYEVEKALENKNVRLARIPVYYQGKENSETGLVASDNLREMNPLDIFSAYYVQKYGSEVAPEMVRLLQDVVNEVSQEF